MAGKVEVKFLKRDLTNVECGPAHWAFLLKSATFLCIIEYDDEGIVIKYYKHERGIRTVCSGMMGRTNRMDYNDSFKTNKNFAEILQHVDSRKTEWSTEHYSSCKHNCQHFVQSLGEFMLGEFMPYDFVSVVIGILWGSISTSNSNFHFQSRQLY
jgi:hypothetical protein